MFLKNPEVNLDCLNENDLHYLVASGKLTEAEIVGIPSHPLWDSFDAQFKDLIWETVEKITWGESLGAIKNKSS